ncbi:hypothetical protein J2Y68_001565 [Paenarthrobacter nitroguajacolicus]|nr:hypothetical protein [Paenarthrobacter nitroguajacolicus]
MALAAEGDGGIYTKHQQYAFRRCGTALPTANDAPSGQTALGARGTVKEITSQFDDRRHHDFQPQQSVQ